MSFMRIGYILPTRTYNGPVLLSQDRNYTCLFFLCSEHTTHPLWDFEFSVLGATFPEKMSFSRHWNCVIGCVSPRYTACLQHAHV